MAVVPSERSALRAGVVTLATLAAAVVVVLVFVGDPPWRRQLRVSVYFAHAGPLRPGAALIQAGRTVGEVEALGLVGAGTPGPLDGGAGVVARVAIDRRYAGGVPGNAELFVSSRGPLSERFLEIGPPAGGVAPAPPIRAGAALRGVDPPSLDRVLQNTWTNLMIARRFADEVGPELRALMTELDAARATLGAGDDLGPRWAALVEHAGAAWAELGRTQALLEGAEVATRWPPLLARAQAVAARVGVVLAELGATSDALVAELDRVGAVVAARGGPGLVRLQQALASARAGLARVGPIAAAAAEVLGRVGRGQGSLGKLLHDPEFPEDAKELGKIMKRQPWRIVGHPDDERPAATE